MNQRFLPNASIACLLVTAGLAPCAHAQTEPSEAPTNTAPETAQPPESSASESDGADSAPTPPASSTDTRSTASDRAADFSTSQPPSPAAGSIQSTKQRQTGAAAATATNKAASAPRSTATSPAVKPSRDATQPRPDVELASQTSVSDQPAQEPNKDAASDEDDGGGLFGPIRLGPMVGVGLPNVLSFGGLLKLTRYIGAGINIGVIPTIRVSYYGDATLRYQEYDAFGRIFPFGGGFFMGAGVGYETVKGTMADTMDTSAYTALIQQQGLGIPGTLSYQSAGAVKTMVLTPQIGYFYTTSVGFSIGLDVGAQVPIAPSQIKFSSRMALPATTPQTLVDQIHTQLLDPTDQKVYSTLKTIGRTPLPTFNIRIGWLL